jgi:hypothetical protein
MLTGDGVHGRILHVFTSEDELRRRSGAAHPLWLPFQGIRGIIEQQGFAGVVLNPEGPWIFIGRAELATVTA